MTSMTLNGVISQNKVIKNAFLLVAISLLPTILGSWVGLMLGVPAILASAPIISAIVFMVVSLGILYVLNVFANDGKAIPIMFLFTFLMGIVLSGIISVALSKADGMSIITMAALGTAAIAIGCSIYAATTKRDFSSIGGFLFGSVIAIIIAGLVNIWLQLSIVSLIISALSIVIFSVFMVFDVQRVIKGGETNYVLAAVSIYLNLYNIFSSLLSLMLNLDSDD